VGARKCFGIHCSLFTVRCSLFSVYCPRFGFDKWVLMSQNEDSPAPSILNTYRTIDIYTIGYVVA